MVWVTHRPDPCSVPSLPPFGSRALASQLCCWNKSWGRAATSCHVCQAAGLGDSGVSCLILFSGMRGGLTLHTNNSQRCIDSSPAMCFPALHLKCFSFSGFSVYSSLSPPLFQPLPTPSSGWSQSDHGDKSVAETCKFMVHDCANGPWERASSMDLGALSYMILGD